MHQGCDDEPRCRYTEPIDAVNLLPELRAVLTTGESIVTRASYRTIEFVSLFCVSSHLFAEVVGLSNGKFRVNESGAATYSIDIEAPDGRAGVAPDISLNYSSNNRIEGSVGVGWSIGGVQTITRCPQSPIYDNHIQAVNFSNADRFCLDGRRLVLISGTYGAPNSTYRLEVDNLTTITARGGSSSNGPQYFELVNKAGETHYFGNTSSLTTVFNNPSDSTDAFVEPAGYSAGVLAKAWALKAIEDVKGNYITFDYDKGRLEGTHFIEAINYSGHRPSGRAPFAEIRFVYDDYQKGFVGYQGGTEVFRDRLLTRVYSRIDGDFYRVFHLDYEITEFIEERTLLTSVQECPDNSVSRSQCLPATTFEWERPALATSTIQEYCIPEEGGEEFCFDRPTSTNYNPYPSGSTTVSGTASRFTTQVLDMNGDGFHDLVYLETGYWKIRTGPFFNNEELLTTKGTSSPEYALNIDYDGNGTRDLLVADSTASSWEVIAYSSGYGDVEPVPQNCSELEPCSPVPITTSALVDPLGRTAIGSNGKALVLDVNGDSLEDIVFQQGTALKAYMNQGRGDFSAAVTLFTGEGEFFTDIAQSNAHLQSASAFDVNGDGRSDLFLNVSAGVCFLHGEISPFLKTAAECNDANGTWDSNYTTRELLISTGTMSAPTFTKLNVLDEEINTVRTADFNGDGLQDVAYVRGSTWFYRIADGLTLLAERSMGITTNSTNKAYSQFVDLNGDGRVDVLHATSTSHWDVYFSRPTNLGNLVAFEKRGGFNFPNQAAVRFGDMNGDGKIDLLTSTGTTWRIYFNRPGVHEYVIRKITNGFGVKTDISYSSLTDDSVYVFPYSEALEHPETMSPVFAAMHVVDRVQTDSNSDGVTTDRMAISYEYGGLLIHRKGRGSLGFQMLRTIDEQSGVISETRYAQGYSDTEFPLTGMPVYSEQRLNGQLLSASVNTLDTVTTAQGGLFPYVETSEEFAYVLGSDGLSQLVSMSETIDVYDSWGNLERRDESTSDSGSGEEWPTTTKNFFGNTTEQRFGRLKWTQVSKSRNGFPGGVTRRTDFTYDADLMLQTSTVSPQDAATRLTTTYSYDEFGNTIAKSVEGYSTPTGEPQTRSVQTVYDSRGRYIAYQENALGEQVRYEYNGTTPDLATGVMLSMTEIDPNGLATTSYYNGLGQVVSSSLPDERVSSVVRSYCSNCLGEVTHYKELTQVSGQPDSEAYFDRWGRQVIQRERSFAGGWNSVVTEYDEEGRQKVVYEPNSTSYKSVYYYDALDRITQVTAPDNSVTQYSYEPFATVVTNANAQVTRTVKNGFGEIAYTVDNMGNEVHFVRDAYGNLRETETRADGDTSVVTAVYNNWGRKTSTTDPVKGTWTYTYNAFGELYTQTTARGHTFTLTHDALGRKIRSYEPNEGTLCWVYGTVGDENAHAVGQLLVSEKYEGAEVECDRGLLGILPVPDIRKSYSYDELARLVETATKIGSQTHRISQTYDGFSRPLTNTFPGGLFADFTARNVYNAYGYLEEVIDDSDGSSLRKINTVNARGQIETETLGNGVVTNRVFEADRGRLETISASSNGNLRHYIDVWYDALGNVRERESEYYSALGSQARFSEQYQYDSLNRLKNRYATVYNDAASLPTGFADNQSFTYDGWGNIRFKSGVGYYKYDPSKVHRLTGIYQNSNYSGTQYYSFNYDANGNVLDDGTRSFEYGSFDKATYIADGVSTAEMQYGPDRELYSRVETTVEGGSNVTYTRLYLGSYEKVTRFALLSGASEHKYTIGDVIVTRKAFGGLERHYLHKDHQGSVIAITDDEGDVVSQAVYDPFGKKSAVYVSSVFSGTFITEPTQMGYTGHREVASLGIVDMLGRIYDAKIGRFLQADPFVQDENNSQSYNRYSYVMNNPMSYTDPSGYFVDKLWEEIKPFIGVIIAVVATIICNACSGPLWAMAIGAVAGAAQAAANGGNVFSGALIGAFSALVFYGIGSDLGDFTSFSEVFANGANLGRYAAKVYLHGFTGGIMSVAQGGKFGAGFASAGLTQAAAPGISGIKGDGAGARSLRVAVAATVGGTASKVSGGKFANGAVTGAFSRAFNDEAASHRRKSFYDGFDRKFLADFRENYPVEYSLFKEYALSIDTSLWANDFRHYELAWRGFDSFARSGSAALLSMSAQDFVTNVYGPQNLLSSIGGRIGAAFGLYNDAGSYSSAGNLVRISNEAISIRIHGPQVINEGLFREAFHRGYDASLNSVVR